MKKVMKVVQCWDDGVSSDITLMDILRKHNAKATFNLNAGLHKKERSAKWEYKENVVQTLGWNEMKEVYDGFAIANHSLTHPLLDKIPVEEARKDIVEGRKRLQDFFDAPISGFVYPCGAYNETVMDLLRDAGHIYARTTQNAAQAFPPDDAMAFHPTCKFDSEDFWNHYEKARECGVFYFWGHSYELINGEMWKKFEDKIKRITADEESCWVDVVDLF